MNGLREVLAAHEFDFGGMRVQRDEAGSATGYTLACLCGFEYPPSSTENHLRNHVEREVLAWLTARTAALSAENARLTETLGRVSALRPNGKREWESQGRSGVCDTVDYVDLRAALEGAD